MPQTSAEYAANGGCRCPHCDSEEVDGRQPFESDIGVAWQHMTCTDCGAEWDDDYQLTGYAELSIPEKE